MIPRGVFYRLWDIWEKHIHYTDCDIKTCQLCTKLLEQQDEFLKLQEEIIRARSK